MAIPSMNLSWISNDSNLEQRYWRIKTMPSPNEYDRMGRALLTVPCAFICTRLYQYRYIGFLVAANLLAHFQRASPDLFPSSHWLVLMISYCRSVINGL